jgi:class 3 adenylate cyclase/tetratricopeptide (TPR) repeat protein
VEVIASESERRQLSLLFCDVVESTALSERLDPEDLHDLLSSYRRVCQDAIGLFEGHTTHSLGDGLMAYFGFPTAHEDDAVRAVRAGLRILDDIKLVNQGIGKRLGIELHIRVGVHTGLTVVGEPGPGGTNDRLAVGEAVNLAARIEAVADLDSAFVSGATARLIGGHFVLNPRGAQMLKGFTKPVELFQVVGETGARTHFEAVARGPLTPHVGRYREVAELNQAWKEVSAGHDRAVIVRGEAGIGKSRIIHHFQQIALGEGAQRLHCVCSTLTQATALAPITEMLKGRVLERAGRDDAPEASLQALASLLSEHSRFGADALPLLATLLSIPGADQKAIQGLSPVRRRARTLEILRGWLAWSAERVPVALFIEDVHWADPSTIDLLDLIIRDRPGGRTLVCLTARPEFQARWSQPHVRTIELNRLDTSAVEAVVSHVSGGHALPPLVVKRIAERSEGVPLYLEEVTKVVLESGAVQLKGSRYELVRPLDDQILPPTVTGSLVARFDRLGESRSIAQLGAAIGREFSYRLIRAVSGLSDSDLRQHLDRLSRSELAFVNGQPPNSTYAFKHALIQDAIYGTLLNRDRARVHERIFIALQEQFPEVFAARPEMAAYHAEHAGHREEAVHLLRDSGMKALGRTAIVEAVKHLAHAIELVDVLEEPARTDMEIELQAAIGPAYMATLGWAVPEVERSCARLRDLATKRGDGVKLYQAMWGIWTVHFLRGEYEPALDVAKQVLAMALQTGDPMLAVTGHHAVGYTHLRRGEYAEAIRHADEGIALFDLEREKQIATLFALSSSCAIWWFRGQAQLAIGDLQNGVESLARAQKVVDDIGHTPSRAFLLSQQCLSLGMDDVGTIETMARTMRSLSIAEGFALWVPYADIFLAWASAQRGGDALAAAENIRSAMALVHQGLSQIQDIEFTRLLAETLLLASKPTEVIVVTEAALETARARKQGHLESELFRMQGEAARMMGETGKAVALYRQAIESARSLGARLLELRATLSLARVGGDDERGLLMRALSGFNDRDDHPDLRNARAFLATPGPQGSSASTRSWARL